MTTTLSAASTLATLRNVRDLIGHELRANDGLVGEVKDIYFDDQQWCVRYFVVETGPWLHRRRVLISPESVHAPEWKARILPVDLSQDQIRASPSVETDRPVSRQEEQRLRQYYGWPVYWTELCAPAGFELAPPVFPPALLGQVQPPTGSEAPRGDAHLRSAQEIFGYRLRATDGELGHVDDLLIEDHAWHVRYLVVDTRNWLPGRKVVVSPWWTTDVLWQYSEIAIDLARETIRHSPPYDAARPMTVDEAGRLHDYYRRPHTTGWRQSLILLGVESPAFENGGVIPSRYTAYGANQRIPVRLSGVPEETVSLALIIDDPDAPKGLFTHWIVFNLNPQLHGIGEDENLPDAQQGLNDAGTLGYTGPKPPDREHRYFIRLYALDQILDLPTGADREAFVKAMAGHLIADAVWVGRSAPPSIGS